MLLEQEQGLVQIKKSFSLSLIAMTSMELIMKQQHFGLSAANKNHMLDINVDSYETQHSLTEILHSQEYNTVQKDFPLC